MPEQIDDNIEALRHVAMVVDAAPGWHIVINEPTTLRAVDEDLDDDDPSVGYSRVRVMPLRQWGAPCPPLYFKSGAEAPISVEDHIRRLKLSSPFAQKLLGMLGFDEDGDPVSRAMAFPFMIPLDPREEKPTFLIKNVHGVYPPEAGTAEEIMASLQELGEASASNYREAKRIIAEQDG